MCLGKEGARLFDDGNKRRASTDRPVLVSLGCPCPPPLALLLSSCGKHAVFLYVALCTHPHAYVTGWPGRPTLSAVLQVTSPARSHSSPIITCRIQHEVIEEKCVSKQGHGSVKLFLTTRCAQSGDSGHKPTKLSSARSSVRLRGYPRVHGQRLGNASEVYVALYHHTEGFLGLHI